MNRLLPLTATLIMLLGLASCGSDSDQQNAAANNEPAPDVTAEVQQYYADHPEFFGFKSPADIPTDLVWENGQELSEIGRAHV